ncbi:MAG: PfkB family carbohydrate kinase [Patescibacteria group bacterium]|nr:PfkB family carbohydrate kinase [Patescibacteria group bacterium]
MSTTICVIGHTAFNVFQNPSGDLFKYPAGAGFAVAWSMSKFLHRMHSETEVNLISVCGNDFDLRPLIEAGVVTSYVVTSRDDKSDIFRIREDVNGGRTFKSEGNLSVSFPNYLISLPINKPLMVHLATATPQEQLAWFKRIRESWGGVPISADTFELYVQQNPKLVAEVLEKVDLFFANQVEWTTLIENNPEMDWEKIPPVILKKGREGASCLIHGEERTRAPAISVKVVDPTLAGEVLASYLLASFAAPLNEGKSLEGYITGAAFSSTLREACRWASLSIRQAGILDLFESIELREGVYSSRRERRY